MSTTVPVPKFSIDTLYSQIIADDNWNWTTRHPTCEKVASEDLCLGVVWHFSKSKWKQCNNTDWSTAYFLRTEWNLGTVLYFPVCYGHLILQIFEMSFKTHWYCFQTTEVLFDSHPLFFDSTVCLRRLFRCRMNSWYNSRGLNVLWTFEMSPKTHWEFHCVLGNF